MLQSTQGKLIKSVLAGKSSKGFLQGIFERATDLLTAIDASQVLADLRFPPSNRLEDLSGDRSGQNSVRINKKWFYCFTCGSNESENVELSDYH